MRILKTLLIAMLFVNCATPVSLYIPTQCKELQSYNRSIYY